MRRTATGAVAAVETTEGQVRMRVQEAADARENARIVGDALDRIVAGYVFPERTAEIERRYEGGWRRVSTTRWTAPGSVPR